MDFLVDGEDVGLLGFGLFDLDGITWFKVFDIRHLELEKVASTDSVVDAESEQQQITGFFRQIYFYRLDILGALDGMDENFGARLRMVGIFHGQRP